MNRLGKKANETLIEMALSADGEECNGPLCETISTSGSEVPSSSEGLNSTETTLLIPEHQVDSFRSTGVLHNAWMVQVGCCLVSAVTSVSSEDA